MYEIIIFNSLFPKNFYVHELLIHINPLTPMIDDVPEKFLN